MSNGRLKGFVERVLRLREERAALTADIRDVMAEAKAVGFDLKVLGAVVRRAEQDPALLAEFDQLVAAYEDDLADADGAGPVSGDLRLQAAFGAAPSRAALARSKAAARTDAWLETGKGN